MASDFGNKMVGKKNKTLSGLAILKTQKNIEGREQLYLQTPMNTRKLHAVTQKSSKTPSFTLAIKNSVQDSRNSNYADQIS